MRSAGGDGRDSAIGEQFTQPNGISRVYVFVALLPGSSVSRVVHRAPLLFQERGPGLVQNVELCSYELIAVIAVDGLRWSRTPRPELL